MKITKKSERKKERRIMILATSTISLFLLSGGTLLALNHHRTNELSAMQETVSTKELQKQTRLHKTKDDLEKEISKRCSKCQLENQTSLIENEKKNQPSLKFNASSRDEENQKEQEELRHCKEEARDKILKEKEMKGMSQEELDELRDSLNQSIEDSMKQHSKTTNSYSNTKGLMDYDSVKIPSIEEVKNAHCSKNKTQALASVIGTLSIPSLNIKLNILEGTNNVNMMYGVTTLLPNEKMGEGNYALAGHNMAEHHILLSDIIWKDIPRVHKDDKIILSDGYKKYVYRIQWIKIVEMTDTSMLNLSEEPILTLVTCCKDQFNTGATKYRFIVRAKLES